MKITGITWRGYALPFRRQFATASNQATTRSGLLVFLRSDEGLTGVGEASPVGLASVDEITEVAAALETLNPRLLEKDVGEVEQMISTSDIPAVLRFGLETALMDLRGQAAGCPLTVLLGGKPLSSAVNCLITAESPEQAAFEAREGVASGFTSLKLKIGRITLNQDEAIVQAVRLAVGPKVKLRLDPNQAWDTTQAIESIGRLAQYNVEYIEQPVPAANIAGLAAVRRAVSVPVAADESLGSLDNLNQLLSANAAGIFILKAARLGGLKRTLEVARAVLKAGRQVVVTTSLESDVGVAASLHLAAVLPSQSHAHGLATGLLFVENLNSSPLLPVNGMMQTPTSSGLGVKVDSNMLNKYRSDIMGSAGSRFEL